MAFSKEVRSRANESSTEGSAPEDEEFTNHVRFLQELETYCTLKYAATFSESFPDAASASMAPKRSITRGKFEMQMPKTSIH
jgi:hypothetical protein